VLLGHFYFDTLTHDPQAARHLINRVGADHVVIGSDHPFDMGPPDLMAAIDAIPDLSASEREYVCSLTALALLRED
jgi:aminocarboxymuconate-semialdehyde decarboxylase